LDSVSTPTIDLNFNIPKKLFYNVQTYADCNLFNLYHRKGIAEITDKDSKLITLFCKLNEVDILNLSFRNYYFIDKQYYRLYEVEFDTVSNNPTKLKLLKLSVAPDFVATSQIINGGIGNIGTDPQPIFDQGLIKNGNSYNYLSDNYFNGYNNISQGGTQLINSDGNLINADKITVLGGENNTLINDGGTYLGTNNYKSVRDKETVINNIDQPLNARIILRSAELQNLNTTPIEVLASVDGFWTEIFDAYITMYFENATPVAYNNVTLSLQYNGDATSLCDFVNGITAVTTATKQRGEVVLDSAFKSLAVEIIAASTLGAAGNGKALIELHYRLHPIIR
jgi:hypothetical protein